MRVVQKEDKRVDSFYQWYVFLFIGGFESVELHAVGK